MVNGVCTKVCSCGIGYCVSTIDGYGFSVNYVDRGNTTDNTFQSLYDFFIEYNVISIYIYIYIYIYTVRLI